MFFQKKIKQNKKNTKINEKKPIKIWKTNATKK